MKEPEKFTGYLQKKRTKERETSRLRNRTIQMFDL